MDNIFLTVVITTITIAIIGMIVWLIFEHKKLKQDYRTLYDYLERNNRDIAGLCSAAVSIDNQLSDNNLQFDGVIKKIADLEQQEHTSQPYHSAIQMVRNGAGIEELIDQCSLSQEEATLLIRLHGNSKNGK